MDSYRSMKGLIGNTPCLFVCNGLSEKRPWHSITVVILAGVYDWVPWGSEDSIRKLQLPPGRSKDSKTSAENPFLVKKYQNGHRNFTFDDKLLICLASLFTVV